jgi:hypothetical protein
VIRIVASVLLVALTLPESCVAADHARGTWFSRQTGPGRAEIGAAASATHDVSRTEPPSAPIAQPPASSTVKPDPNPGPSLPTLPKNSKKLDDPTPLGPGSFWYQDVYGDACIHHGATDGTCFTVTGADSQPRRPRVDVGALVRRAADQLDLVPGTITSSPPRGRAVTGSVTWLWLDPPAATQAVAAAAGGEQVTVTATPHVAWDFGDAGDASGSAEETRPTGVPAEAVAHTYETRCLPGDRGRDPYVSDACGQDGYALSASVTWTITYRATGPIDAAGGLPTRTTSTSADHPVTELRAYLDSSTS